MFKKDQRITLLNNHGMLRERYDSLLYGKIYWHTYICGCLPYGQNSKTYTKPMAILTFLILTRSKITPAR